MSLDPQVLDMERKILKTLGFDLVSPTTKSFVRRYLRAADSLPNDKVRTFSKLFLRGPVFSTMHVLYSKDV
jgi:hypothetical protein